MLFYIVRYRVHIHITYQPRQRSRRRTAETPRPDPQASTSGKPADAGRQRQAAELVSALVNLGARKPEARAAVEQAMSAGPASFDQLLRRAIAATQVPA
jgi:Holliday junction resolvasome RuvABC DNA-binding subunit